MKCEIEKEDKEQKSPFAVSFPFFLVPSVLGAQISSLFVYTNLL
uniref:Uncharacterized protein n=1 Tax=Rhizophora mucronata TaxID=61149 RepID=A0A2P2P2F6_RHIMU